jgi:hypothetical protein
MAFWRWPKGGRCEISESRVEDLVKTDLRSSECIAGPHEYRFEAPYMCYTGMKQRVSEDSRICDPAQQNLLSQYLESERLFSAVKFEVGH